MPRSALLHAYRPALRRPPIGQSSRAPCGAMQWEVLSRAISLPGRLVPRQSRPETRTILGKISSAQSLPACGALGGADLSRAGSSGHVDRAPERLHHPAAARKSAGTIAALGYLAEDGAVSGRDCRAPARASSEIRPWRTLRHCDRRHMALEMIGPMGAALSVAMKR